MATVKVKFRPSTVADRQGSIIYLVTHRRVARQMTTSYKIYPHEWDKQQSKLIVDSTDKRLPILQSVAQKICHDMKQLEKVIEMLESRPTDYTSDDIVTAFRRNSNDNTLFKYMESIIYRLRQLGHLGTAHNYQAAFNSIKRFRNGADVTFDEITHILVEDYQAYLKSMGLAPNSISFYMRIFRAVYNRIVEQELSSDRKPFRTAFTGREKTRKRAISVKDIKCIKELDLSMKPNLEFARDVFMFLFYCRGMSFVDAAFLKKSDVQNGMISYRRHKTNQLLHIKVVSQIQDIINRYTDADSPYLLPIINRPGTDERRQYESTLRSINNALKEIAKMIKLPIALSTYVSRHSWATIAKSKNVSVNVISDALGHDSLATTQIYLASIDTSTIDHANELIIKGL